MFVLFLLVLTASVHNSLGQMSEKELACLQNGQIYSQKNDSCYFATTRGPCQDGEWFVLTRAGNSGLCRERECGSSSGSCRERECGGSSGSCRERECGSSGSCRERECGGSSGSCRERECRNEKMVEVEGKCRWLADSRVCPGLGEKLWTNMYGKGECGCQEGFYRHSDGRCYQEFTAGWCSNGQVLLNLRHLNETKECRTVNNTDTGAVKFNSDVACVFPFRFKGKTYDGCTAAGAADGVPWCSTKVDELGGHVIQSGQWGPCSSNCPASGFPTITLDGIVPGNEINALLAVDLVKVKNMEKLVCRDNPCGNPDLKLMWYDGKCHAIWEDLDECVVELREDEGVEHPSVGKLLCEFDEIVPLSIGTNSSTKRQKCKRGQVWSKRMKKCAKNPFTG